MAMQINHSQGTSTQNDFKYLLKLLKKIVYSEDKNATVIVRCISN